MLPRQIHEDYAVTVCSLIIAYPPATDRSLRCVDRVPSMLGKSVLIGRLERAIVTYRPYSGARGMFCISRLVSGRGFAAGSYDIPLAGVPF